MNDPSARACLFALALLLGTADAEARVTLPAIFGDHMVLQAGRPMPVWGWAEPGERVVVTIGRDRREAVTDQTGVFRIELPAQPATRTATTLVVEGENRIAVGDVLIGQVWLGSGQSNMAMTMGETGEPIDDDDAARRLRLFRVENVEPPDPSQARDVRGRWELAQGDAVRRFSAVGHHFGLALSRALSQPIGVIVSARGGSPAESWVPVRHLREDKRLRHIVKHAAGTTPAARAAALDAFKRAEEQWDARNRHHDPPNQGEAQGFARVGLTTTDWHPMHLPGLWESVGLDVDGVIWFRRTVELPASLRRRDLQLSLGPINDCGTVYVNGRKLGGSCRGVGQPGPYAIDAALAAENHGQLLIAVRVFDERGRGGLGGRPDELYIAPHGAQTHDRLSLAGVWLYKPERLLPAMRPRWVDIPHPAVGVADYRTPGALYETMIAPLLPFAIAGVLFYQGEANTGRAAEYRALFPTLIAAWRSAFRRDDLPFYFVQLAGYEVGRGGGEDWAELREAQAHALALPATGMAVAIDVGDRTDIHPRDKHAVGERLARIALRRVYGHDVDDSGPLHRSHTLEHGRVRIRFDHGDGLTTTPAGSAPLGFEIAAADGRFFPALAVIEGESVIVWSPHIGRPQAVRYGWTGFPDGNLRNRADLPAAPFRSGRVSTRRSSLTTR